MADEVIVGKPRLLERVSMAIRARHYSRRTEEAYVFWIRKFILFHQKRHPSEMGAPEVSAFLGWLATDRGVAASTQNQALSALLFMYRDVCGSSWAISTRCHGRGFPGEFRSCWASRRYVWCWVV